MKLQKDEIMMAFAAAGFALSLSACSAVSAVLDTPDLSGPDFTNEQAVSKMEDTVKARGATGALQTVCNYDDSIDDPETYHCTTLVKDSMVVLYADCTTDQCAATGYDKVEKE